MMRTKHCTKCKTEKPVDQFFRCRPHHDGLQYECKPCHIERTRQWKQKNREKVRNTQEQWNDNNRDKCIRYSQNRTVTPERVKQQVRLVAKYRHRHPERVAANRQTQLAIDSGNLIRPKQCSQCSRKCKPVAHHDDYDNPLDITWLCGSCHGVAHRETPNVETNT